MEGSRIAIWLSPEKESQLLHKELAPLIGITVATLQQRLRTLGVDHCLTYYPGPIPPRLRTMRHRGGINRSKLALIKIERLSEHDLDTRTCMRFVTKLVHHSLDDLKKFGCRASETFLSNRDGMLHYYLELIPGIDVQTFINYAQAQVMEIKLARRHRSGETVLPIVVDEFRDGASP